MNNKIICPVCGIVNAVEKMPWHYEGNEFVASQDICPCCGTHYGEDDWAENEKEIEVMHVMLRKKWIADGMKWKSRKVPIDFPNDELTLEKLRSFPDDSPPNWDPKKQLENISSDLK